MMSVSAVELVLMALSCAVPVAAIVGLVLVIKGSSAKTKLGVNLTPPKQCPRCGHPLPLLRRPKNLRQAMWGGTTCQGCQTELDKWGRIVGE